MREAEKLARKHRECTQTTGKVLGGEFANQGALQFCPLFRSSPNEVGGGMGGRLQRLSFLGFLDFFVDGTILRNPQSGALGG